MIRFRRVVGLIAVYLLPLVLMFSGALAWLAKDGQSPANPTEAGDGVRDAVVRAFENSVFAAADQERPSRWLGGRDVRVEFAGGDQAIPESLRRLVEQIGAASHGRVTTGAGGVGEITVRIAALDQLPCLVRSEVRMGGVLRGDIVVDASAPTEAVNACFADAILPMLGLSHRPAMGSPFLSEREKVLLSLLFSPQLTPAMNRRAEILAAVRRQLAGMSTADLCRQGQGFC